MSPMSARAWALSIPLSVPWGGGFLSAGLAVREWPPLSIALSRVALALRHLLGMAGIAAGLAPIDGRLLHRRDS